VLHALAGGSKQINEVTGPAIISASGMTAGHAAPPGAAGARSRNLILLVGFQAEGTRGRALQDDAKALKIHGDGSIAAEVPPCGNFPPWEERIDALADRPAAPPPPTWCMANPPRRWR
jgi:metallo-beta-lactamase family protein